MAISSLPPQKQTVKLGPNAERVLRVMKELVDTADYWIDKEARGFDPMDDDDQALSIPESELARIMSTALHLAQSCCGSDSDYYTSLMELKAWFRTRERAMPRPMERGLLQFGGIIQSLQDSIKFGFILIKEKHSVDDADIVRTICKRFHLATRTIEAKFSMNDEYDVQDLLHAVLRVNFDDVRAEEYCPTYAGGKSRIDFVLQKQRIAIEVKKTRHGLESKEIGAELAIDILRYQPANCDLLVCFVYDPDNRIKNPKGLEADLSKKWGELNVEVIITPT